MERTPLEALPTALHELLQLLQVCTVYIIYSMSDLIDNASRGVLGVAVIALQRHGLAQVFAELLQLVYSTW